MAYLGQLCLNVIHSSLSYLLRVHNVSARYNTCSSAIPEVYHTLVTIFDIIRIFLRVILFANLIRETFLLHYEVLLLVHCGKVDCFPSHVIELLAHVLVDIF